MQGKGKKAKLVRQPVEAFDVVAREVSSDPNVAETGGELGWITPFRYVYPLEEAVYETPVGEISEVFRTQYGFHIVKVEEERDHREVRARHIMKMVPADSLDAEKKAEIDGIAKNVNANNNAPFIAADRRFHALPPPNCAAASGQKPTAAAAAAVCQLSRPPIANAAPDGISSIKKANVVFNRSTVCVLRFNVKYCATNVPKRQTRVLSARPALSITCRQK